MSKFTVTDFVTYRYRYLLSYIGIGVLLIALLYVAGVLIPGGISASEMLSATKSGNLSFGALIGSQPDNIANLPYRSLQAVSIHLFGLSALSIKLPSLLIAGASVVLFYRVLRLWFRANVAVITTIILMTSSLFLLQSQLGTAGIMYIFWGSLLLFCTSKMAHSKVGSWVWLLASSLIAGLSIYSPYACYIVIPLVLAAVLHPHARFIVFRQPLWASLSSIVLFIIVITPLAISISVQPSVALQLVAGATIASGDYNFSESASQLSQYIDFYNNHSGRLLQPAYGMGLLLIAIVGLVHLLRAKYTAKSYIMLTWLIFTIPVLFFNPEAASTSLLPVMLLVAFAVDFIIRRWYRMFPRNPYARIAGLFPLGILVIGLSISSLDRFVYGYSYNTDASTAYSNDLQLVNEEVKRQSGPVSLVVSPKEKQFYDAYAKYSTPRNVTITVTSDAKQITTSNQTVILVNASAAQQVEIAPTKIITSSSSGDSNRLYIYKNQSS